MARNDVPSDMTFWRTLAEHLHTGQPAFVGLVADHTRHSPGTRGAQIFVKPNGLQVGTIGGGAMEAALLERAQLSLQSDARQTTRVLHHSEDAPGDRSGLICAGKQTMVYFVADPADAEIFERFADASDADEEVELAIENGHPDIRPRVVGTAPPIELRGEVYAEHAVNRRRVAIVGGGHCGLALSRVMSQLGYHVTNFEVRPDVFTFTQNCFAHERVVVDDYVDAAPRVRFPSLTHFVVMTADVVSDTRAIVGSVGLAFPYKGVMGSASKIARIRALLDSMGVEEGQLGALYAPIGLQMTSNTPEEIAISIAAQILQERERLFPWARPSATNE